MNPPSAQGFPLPHCLAAATCVMLLGACASPVRVQHSLGSATIQTALLKEPAPAAVREAMATARTAPADSLARLIAAAGAATADLASADGQRVYNAAVAGVVTTLNEHFPAWVSEPPAPLTIDFSALPFDPASEGFTFRLASSLRSDGFTRTYRRDGVGCALIATASSDRATRLADHFPPEGRFYPVTAYLEIPEAGTDAQDAPAQSRPVLRLVDSKAVGEVRLGGGALPLAADFSLAHALLLDGSDLQAKRFVGLFSTEKFSDRQGLFLMDPYDPAKVPLIMVHGFASSPVTWFELTNALNGADDLRDRYQVWQYAYPTGVSFIEAAREFRETLDHFHEQIAAEGLPAPRHRPVYVAHSMGGLLVKSLLCDSGESLADVADAPDTPGLHFMLSPHAGRTVFVATPFRGSGLATGPYAKIASSIDAIPSLSKDNAILAAFADLPIDGSFPFHVVLGRRFPLPNGNSSDGLVSLESGRHPGAASELVIETNTHNVHHQPEAVAAILDILRLNLREPLGVDSLPPVAAR